MILPCEIYFNPEKKVTLFMLRSSIGKGRMRKFEEEFVKFYREGQFSNLVLLTSTISPIKRGRESNRQ